MKPNMSLISLRSNLFTLGIFIICNSLINFIYILPSLGNTESGDNNFQIFNSSQVDNNSLELEATKEPFVLQNTINLPTETQTDDENTSIQQIAEEIHLLVKLHKKRVYVYQGDKLIKSYPIAIGKKGYETPKGSFTIFSKEMNPIFKNFKTGQIIPPGQNNPLGSRWIGVWTDGKTQIGFHGTNRPESIGKAASHGCMRMHNQDVLALFEKVKIGTVVKIVP